MTLPANIQPGTLDPIPDGVFLVPLCTTREALIEMIYALDSAHVQTGKLLVIKDFLNALQYLENPQDAICMSGVIDPDPPDVTIQEDGDCQRVLIDGIAVTGWICPNQAGVQTVYETIFAGDTCEGDCEMAGCSENIKNWKFIGGVLNVRTCDGWEPIPGQVGASLGAAGLSGSDVGLQAWEDAGKPNLSAGQTPIASGNPLYTTDASLGCAKATAFVEAIHQWMQDTRDGIEESGLSILGLMATFESLLAPLGLVSAAGSAASLVFGIFVGTSMEDSIDQFDAALAGIDWDGVICQAVPLMAPVVTLGLIKANQATEADYAAVIGLIEDSFDVDPKVSQFLHQFPMSVIQADVKKRLPAQDCGCDQYLPYGYTPSADSGKIQFVRMISSGSADINSWYEPASLAAINAVQHGTKTGANSFRTAYIGSGGGSYYQGAGILLLLPTGCEISNVKYTHAWSGSFGEVKLGFYEFMSDGTLHAITYTNDAAGSYDKVVNGAAGATHLIIEVKGSGTTGTGQAVDLTNLLFTGTKATGTFTDKKIGELL